MNKLVMTKGLPGSGKSTWAIEQVNKQPGMWKRVSKDSLRAMLDNNRWTKKNEAFVLTVRDTLVFEGLKAGWNVIVDDTNLNPIHETRLKQLARQAGAIFKVKDFTDVPMELCILQDLKRDSSVGEGVIKEMYNKFLKPPVKPVLAITNGKYAIICDIDGTLALKGDRSPYDWSKVGVDTPNFSIVDILKKYRVDTEKRIGERRLGTTRIILVSGRDEVCRKETKKWLKQYDIPYDDLYMRPKGDNRKDSIVKEEIFKEKIEGKYNILFVLDDRNQVVDLWRSLGLTCLQVAEGDF